MEFFGKARERGWLCEEVLTEKFPVRCLFALWPPPVSVVLATCQRGDRMRYRRVVECARGLRKTTDSFAAANVSRGPWRGGGTVDRAWLAAHAAVESLMLP